MYGLTVISLIDRHEKERLTIEVHIASYCEYQQHICDEWNQINPNPHVAPYVQECLDYVKIYFNKRRH